MRFVVLALLAATSASMRAEAPVGGAPGAEVPRSAGYVESGGRLVYFEVVRDGEVVLGEGAAGRPRVRVPYEAFVDVIGRAAREGALVPDSVGDGPTAGVAFDVDERSVVRLATEVPAGQLAMGLLGIGLLGVVAGGVVWDRRARRAQRLRRTFRHRLAAAREAERAHVARELHDGPVQDLCAIQMALGAGSQSEASPSELSRLAVAAVVGDLRALCDRLRPAALDAFGLPAALAALADRASDGAGTGAGLDVRFTATESARDLAEALPEARRLALYRIAQEALSNACQHAHAQRIDVSLVLDGEALVLTVADDGVGPPADTLMDYAARGHYGLLGMHERADLLRATLRVEPGVRAGGDAASGDASGTRVTLSVPVPALLPASDA